MKKIWKIDKQFNFCYGHRVWSQQLEHEYCEKNDTNTKCRFLHGHEGLVHVFLEADKLERGMVTDFKHLGWLKNFLDDTIDHKFILDINDPWFENIINGKLNGQLELNDGVPTGKFKTIERLNIPRQYGSTRQLPLIPITVDGVFKILGYKIDTSVPCIEGSEVYLIGPEKEFYEGFILIDFVPTSENLCSWLFDITSGKMANLGVKVAQIDWHETAKSRASVSAK